MAIITETSLFKPLAQTTVPARTEPFNAAEFYQPWKRRGDIVDVRDPFAVSFDLHTRQPVGATPARSYVSLLLKDNISVEDLRRAMAAYPSSTLEDIAALIVAQPVHESGFLQNSPDANLFFVEGKFVCVDQDDNDFAWVVRDRVNSWSLDSCRRIRHDCRVFCPGHMAT